MKILIVNRGSSGVKYALFNESLMQTWAGETEPELDSIDVIGHRIVHGGCEFSDSVSINSDVKTKIAKLAELAPLHQLSALTDIEYFEKKFKGVKQVAVFDTTFHRTLSLQAALYPGPYAWYENGIQRYGFHGISHQYCARRAPELLGRTINKMVVCHLGGGASLCAIKNGKSIDTTMGFTPLDGLMMNTRCGSVDPGIVLHLLKSRKLDDVEHELYHKSGLLGISGFSDDMRDILRERDNGNDRAILAFDIYVHRLNQAIGSMMASLQGLDVLVLTGGIGENTPLLREKLQQNWAFLGNDVEFLVMHTDEASEIARESLRLFC